MLLSGFQMSRFVFGLALLIFALRLSNGGINRVHLRGRSGSWLYWLRRGCCCDRRGGCCRRRCVLRVLALVLAAGEQACHQRGTHDIFTDRLQALEMTSHSYGTE